MILDCHTAAEMHFALQFANQKAKFPIPQGTNGWENASDCTALLVRTVLLMVTQKSIAQVNALECLNKEFINIIAFTIYTWFTLQNFLNSLSA